jgi:hypothetical protein
MSKYTREEIIRDRRCGLKYFDKALTKVSIQRLIDDSIACFQDNPNICPDSPWSRMGWSVANVIMEIIDNDVPPTANLDEMFTDDWMTYISQRIHAPLPDTNAIKRKKK